MSLQVCFNWEQGSCSVTAPTNPFVIREEEAACLEFSAVPFYVGSVNKESVNVYV